jgi:alkanesulfonate monooxygenase SsuD/methylene tetrahydromethanopterin reductase-like flavin-dependent oxidoreductase (luciferase family)
MSLRLGLYTNAISWSYEDLRSVWVAAEGHGFESAHLMDNVVGPDPRDPEAGVFEAYIALAALADATETIRIGPMATPNDRRHPSLLAKMTSVLDQVAGGRLVMVMGAGDEPQHFEPWGMPFPERKIRMQMLEEGLQVLLAMWTQEHAEFAGEHYQLSAAVNEPKPVQSPHPPLWLGLCEGRRLMPRLVAQYCDGYNLYVGSEETATAVKEAVDAACRRVDRDPAELTASRHVLVTLVDDEVDLEELYRRQASSIGASAEKVRAHYEYLYCHVAGPPELCVARLDELGAAGFDHVALQFQALDDPLGGSPDSTLELIETFVSQVKPHLA